MEIRENTKADWAAGGQQPLQYVQHTTTNRRKGSSPVLVPLSQVGRVIHPIVLADVIEKPSQALVDSRDQDLPGTAATRGSGCQAKGVRGMTWGGGERVGVGLWSFFG